MWSEQEKNGRVDLKGNLQSEKRAVLSSQHKFLQPYLFSLLKSITLQMCIDFFFKALSLSYCCICQENSLQNNNKKRKIASTFLGEKSLSTSKCFILQNEIQASESELKNYKSEQKENMPPSFEDCISYQDGEKVRCSCW